MLVVVGLVVDVVVKSVVVEGLVLVVMTELVVVTGSVVVVLGISSGSQVPKPIGAETTQLSPGQQQPEPGPRGSQMTPSGVQHRPSMQGTPLSHGKNGPQAPWHGTS